VETSGWFLKNIWSYKINRNIYAYHDYFPQLNPNRWMKVNMSIAT
jgi:hypothetical protein